MASLLRKKSTNGVKGRPTPPPLRGMQNDAARPLPQKPRKRQLNRESMDLDDVMAGSDNEDKEQAENIQPLPSGPRKHSRAVVSASARELLDFLDAGPPDELAPPSKASRDLVEFLATAPPPSTPSHSAITKKSSSGRLQRMMSKFSISERQRSQSISHDEAGFKIQGTVRRIISKPSLSNLTPKPTPSRSPVIPISPPNTPPHDSLHMDTSFSAPPSRKPSRTSPWEEPPMPDPLGLKAPSEHSSIGSRKRSIRNVFSKNASSTSIHTRSPSGYEEAQITRVQRVPVPYAKAGLKDLSHLHVQKRDNGVPETVPSPVVEPPRVPVPNAEEQYTIPAQAEQLCMSAENVYAMRRLLANATNVDECRVILDMFMARSGMSRGSDVPTSAVPSPLEGSIVECLLDKEETDIPNSVDGHR